MTADFDLAPTTYDPTPPANDNKRPPRPVLAWPTGKRLLKAERHSDIAMLLSYRKLMDKAFATHANDNYRDPTPARGQKDTRPAEEAIDQVDLLPEDYSLSIEDLHTLSGVPWRGDPGFDPTKPARPIVTNVDRGGVVRKELGSLAFIYGSHLWEYRRTGEQTHNGQPKWRRPGVVRARHRNKPKSATTLVPNSSGVWELEERIAARQDLYTLYGKLPVSSVKILELALGSLRAQQLGEAFRKSGKTAERFGVQLIDRAIGHLKEHWDESLNCASCTIR